MAQNIIDLLKEDHAHLRTLLSDLVSSTDGADKRRVQLLEQIEAELMLHTQFEEEVFYPAFKEANGKEHETLYFQALEEHRAVEDLVLPDLKNTDPKSAEFAGRAKVLHDLVDKHAREEEQVLFPKALKHLDADVLEEMAEELLDRKSSLEG
jgi:hemerythrin superfamily protein